MPTTLLYRAKNLHEVLSGWLKENEKELESANYSKITLEIIISQRTRNAVKLRSIIQQQSDLSAQDFD